MTRQGLHVLIAAALAIPFCHETIAAEDAAEGVLATAHPPASSPSSCGDEDASLASEASDERPAEEAAEEPSKPTLPPPQPRKFLVDRLAAGASFGYFSNNSLRFLARLHFDFPFIVARQKAVYVSGRLSSSISRIERNFTPRVEDVDYSFEAGTRDYLSPRIAVAAFLGQQGSENLDQSGSASVRYIGFGAQTASFPRPGGEKRLDWNLDVGKVFDTEAETEPVAKADWVIRGDVLWDAVRLPSSTIGADVSFESLVTAGEWRSDWRAGPRWSFDLANGIRASLFGQYIHGRNPLGIGVTGVHLGLSYAEGAYRNPRQGQAPDVRGTLAAGVGDNRSPATYDLQAHLPEILIAGKTIRSFLEVDAETLIGRGPDNFYYFLTAAAETELPHSVFAGAYATHRSYHEISGGESSATNNNGQPVVSRGTPADMNLFEMGLRTDGWEFANRLPGWIIPKPPDHWPGALEWSLRAVYFINSSVEGRPVWMGRAGARWDLPSPGRGYTPFVIAAGDFGEVSRARAGVGIAVPVDMTITGEYRRDNQLRGEDKSEVVLAFSLFY